MVDFFIDEASATLARTLDGAAMRQKALANNIANAETPGFTRQEVSFEAQLQAIVDDQTIDSQTCMDELAGLSIDPHDDTKSPRNENGNNVSLEHEMSEMAKNTLQYEAAAQMLAMRLSALRTAIFEAKR